MNVNSNLKLENTYDAIVVGSGICGGWASKELTEKGLKVLMLERGMNVEHVKDYENAMKHPWEFEHRGKLTQEQIISHPVQSRSSHYSEATEKWCINDLYAPYTEIKRFDWKMGFQVGGRSLIWGRQSYRWSDYNFEENLKDGIAIDWPIRYKDIVSWYDYVEKFAGISGQIENWDSLPDSVFLPPMEMNCVEKTVKKRIENYYKKTRLFTIGRVANLTVPLNGRGVCQYRNKCSRGCPFGASFSTQSTTLPAAMATKNLTLRPYSIVNKVLYNKESKKATGVLVIDTQTNETMEFYAKVIFLNASTLASTFILLNSTSEEHPNGLGNASGQLGHNLMDHQKRCGAKGRAEGFENKYTYGRRPNGIYIARYRNFNGDKRGYLRGFGYQGSASRGNNSNVGGLDFGAEFKNKLCLPDDSWKIILDGYGEMLPDYSNRMYIDYSKKDKWGQPLMAIDCESKENDIKMRKEIISDAVEMLEVAGIKDVKAYDDGWFPGQATHEMGTARMGLDPKTSVLNKWNQLHEVKNVFVTDGSCMTSAANQNPTLTYMALTARACDYAVKELKKGNL